MSLQSIWVHCNLKNGKFRSHEVILKDQAVEAFVETLKGDPDVTSFALYTRVLEWPESRDLRIADPYARVIYG